MGYVVRNPACWSVSLIFLRACFGESLLEGEVLLAKLAECMLAELRSRL